MFGISVHKGVGYVSGVQKCRFSHSDLLIYVFVGWAVFPDLSTCMNVVTFGVCHSAEVTYGE